MSVKKIYEPVDDAHCPNCGRDNLNWDGINWTGTHECANDGICADCETVFTVYYVAVPISIVQELREEKPCQS